MRFKAPLIEDNFRYYHLRRQLLWSYYMLTQLKKLVDAWTDEGLPVTFIGEGNKQGLPLWV
jgi:hypothetical protein